MDGMNGIVILMFWVVCGIGALLIAQGKGAKDTTGWFIVGLLLGPIGLLLSLFAKGSKGEPPG